MNIHDATETAYRNGYEKGKAEATREKQALLHQIKREIHEKAVRPHSAGIDAYVSLKVFDAILQGELDKIFKATR